MGECNISLIFTPHHVLSGWLDQGEQGENGTWHGACMGTRNAYRVLMGKSEGERLLGRPRRGWEYDIKMDLKERDWKGGDFIIWL